ncbi:Fc.00g112290.m01.CDS01 [Cosmosporella sp. VM-42]
MASSQTAPGFRALEERDLDDIGASSSDSGDSGDSFDSRHELIEPQRIPPCPWRTTEFCDQECARFFDCPSHFVERRLSVDHSEEEEPGIDHGERTSATARPRIDADEENHDSDRPSLQEQEQEQPDIYTASPQPEPTSDQEDPLRRIIRPAEGEAASNPFGVPDYGRRINELWANRPDVPTIPIIDEPGSSSRERGYSLPEPQPTLPEGSDGRRHSESVGETNLPSHTRFAYQPVSSGILDDSFPFQVEMASGQGLPPLPRPQQGVPERRPSDFQVPRWQPDGEVTYCPICRTQFSFFVRKHHCRKCGRVVCNSCSPHRIIIPHQYIVRPFGPEVFRPQPTVDGFSAEYADTNAVSGGERVRLCNPCVPDPNTAPPQSPPPRSGLSPRASHQRSRSSVANQYGTMPPSHRHGGIFASGPSNEYRYLSPRSRSSTMGLAVAGSSQGSSHRRSGTHQTPAERLLSGFPTASPSSSYPSRHSSLSNVASSSRQRALPPTPQIAEEDECPICHRELPSISLENYEALRESHIAACIQSHSTYQTLPGGGRTGIPPAAPRRTGMYTYEASEKDCVDDAECTICLEEFTVGVGMARLECLCRFHRACISAWFVNHPGRCPVHQHDGYGY